jgi:glyoxylase-like metal-dependent hydrolase (beta-lactamase superfamily II)
VTAPLSPIAASGAFRPLRWHCGVAASFACPAAFLHLRPSRTEDRMAFLTEPEPTRAAAMPVVPGVRRIVAANPGPMTYHGTNTYLIDTQDGLAVLDPGPDRAEHVRHILDAVGAEKVALIMLSHTHHDHLGAVPALKQATGAPVAGFHKSAEASFAADIKLGHGDLVAGMTALHTPGHCSDHLCFATVIDGTATLFSADHVMSWSSSIVSPPDGDMADYFKSLHLLLGRQDALYLPGHGPPLPAPHDLVRNLLAHRQARETAILEALGADGAADVVTLRERLYSQTDERLRRAAERNVLAHLLKLKAEGKVRQAGDVWATA